MNTLGSPKKVYERCLFEEIRLRGLNAKAQAPFPVRYKGEVVGEYFPDLLLEDQVIVELKCVENFAPEHTAQCLNYLRASNPRVALLLNFRRPKLAWKRIVNHF